MPSEGVEKPRRLENNANNFTPPSEQAFSGRRYRYERRRLMWGESSLERCRKCGRTLRGDGVVVRYREGHGAGFAGLVTCGSVWACPVCNSKIMARRAFEVSGALAVWLMNGRKASFGTYTMRHHKGQSLPELWAAVTDAWHTVTAGKQWKKICRRFGVVGWCKVVEVTFGPNGWHVHIHVLFFLGDTANNVQDLHAAIFARWSRGLAGAGQAEPLASGQEMHLVTGPADEALADYFTKTDKPRNLGLEMTNSQSKAARTEYSTDSVWSLIDRIQTGDAEALDLWHHWEAGSKNKRQISWSGNMRTLLGMMREQSDEQIAREEVGSANDDLVFITAAGWSRLLGLPAVSLADVLTVTERSGLPGLRALLDIEGIEYRLMGEADAA